MIKKSYIYRYAGRAQEGHTWLVVGTTEGNEVVVNYSQSDGGES